jgi:hypothetical protein
MVVNNVVVVRRLRVRVMVHLWVLLFGRRVALRVREGHRLRVVRLWCSGTRHPRCRCIVTRGEGAVGCGKRWAVVGYSVNSVVVFV